MRNILFVYHVSTIGGGSLCLLNIIKKLDRTKFKPIVLLQSEGKLSEELTKLGVKVHYDRNIRTVPYNRTLVSLRVFVNLIRMIISIFRFSSWISKCNADIVYLNTMMLYPYLITSFKKCASIIHVREHWPEGEHELQFKLAKKVIGKLASQIIAINETSKEMLNLEHKTEVVYDWIDFDGKDGFVDFKQIFGDNYESYYIFLYLGGMQRIKGALEIVKAFNSLKEVGDARLLFVGYSQDSEEKKTFKRFIKRIINLTGYEFFSQKVLKCINSDNRIKTLNATANVKTLIINTNVGISFPTIPHAILPIAESIYLKRKIITVKTQEAEEYVGNNANAYFVNPGDIEGLKKSMKRALSYRGTRVEVDNSLILKKFDSTLNSKKLNNVIWNTYNVQK